MCTVVFLDECKQAIYETRMDIFCEQIGEVSDKDYFKIITVKENDTPGYLPASSKRKRHLS